MLPFLSYVENDLPAGQDECRRIQELVEADTPELFLDRVWEIVEQFLS